MMRGGRLSRRRLLAGACAAGAAGAAGGFLAARVGLPSVHGLPPVDLRSGAMARDAAIRWGLAAVRDGAGMARGTAGETASARDRAAHRASVRAFDETFDAPQAAGALPIADRALGLLASERARWAERDLRTDDLEAIAMPLGYLLHRSVEEAIRQRTPPPSDLGASPADVARMQDAAVLRAILPSPIGPPAAIEATLARAAARAGIGLHTYEPFGDIVEWSRALADWQERRRHELRRLAETVAAPPPDLWRRAVDAPDFIAPDDAAVLGAGGWGAGHARASVMAAATLAARHVFDAVDAFVAGQSTVDALRAELAGEPDAAARSG